MSRGPAAAAGLALGLWYVEFSGGQRENYSGLLGVDDDADVLHAIETWQSVES